MDNVVRHGTVIIDVVTGKVQVNAPELASVLANRKEQAVQQEKLNTATEDAVRIQRRHSASLQNVARDLRQAGEGAFILARGVALMTAGSDEDLQKMIRNVAAVQAGFDLFRGSTKVIEGVSAALGVSRVATAGLLATLSPYLLGVGALASAYALWTNRTRQQAAAEEDLAAALRQKREEQERARQSALDDLQTARDRLDEINRRRGSSQERTEDIQARIRNNQRFIDEEGQRLLAGGGAVGSPAALGIRAESERARIRIAELEAELEQIQEEALRTYRDNFRSFTDGVNDTLGELTGGLLGQQRRTGFLEQALQAFKRQ